MTHVQIFLEVEELYIIKITKYIYTIPLRKYPDSLTIESQLKRKFNGCLWKLLIKTVQIFPTSLRCQINKGYFLIKHVFESIKIDLLTNNSTFICTQWPFLYYRVVSAETMASNLWLSKNCNLKMILLQNIRSSFRDFQPFPLWSIFIPSKDHDLASIDIPLLLL